MKNQPSQFNHKSWQGYLPCFGLRIYSPLISENNVFPMPLKKLISLVFITLSSTSIFAAVILNGTRIVYPAASRDVSIQITNVGETPSVIQIWSDAGDSQKTVDTSETPFVITPPMFRIDPGKGQRIRIAYTGEDLPKDRESVFWLNVLEIPPKTKDQQEKNLLQFTVRNRLKIFFRPPDLKGSPIKSAESLEWSLQKTELGAWQFKAKNNSPFSVSLSKINVLTNNEALAVIPPRTINSFSSEIFEVTPEKIKSNSPPDNIGYQFIDDYGNAQNKNQKISITNPNNERSDSQRK